MSRMADRAASHRTSLGRCGGRLGSLAVAGLLTGASLCPAGFDDQCESLREPAGVGKFGCEAKGLLGGAEGVGRFVVGLERQCQAVVNIGSVGEAGWRRRGNLRSPGRNDAASDGRGREGRGPRHFRGELHDLVESRQRLIGLAPRQLDGRDREADLGVVRLEFQGAEVFRQGLVCSSL